MPEHVQKTDEERGEDYLKINMNMDVENLRMVIKIMMKMRKDRS
jgi:hypothetical protein